MKILYVAPHLSTGGMPQYLYKQVEAFCKENEIHVVDVTGSGGTAFVVQKNRIQELVPVQTLSNDKELLSVVKNYAPEVIHYQEIPQTFLSSEVLAELFKDDREHFNIVTTHSSFTNPDEITHHPDKYVFVSKWSMQQFAHLDIPSEIWIYPIEQYVFDKEAAKAYLGMEKDWKHVLHIGLFTPGKNQSEIFQVAKALENYKIKFHFVGNQAGNFGEYWEPLMKNKPDNCIVWGERNDVDRFYEAADLFYFPSKYELSPLAIKEALSYSLPCIFRKLHTYLDDYDEFENVTYINEDINKTSSTILQILNPSKIMYNDLKKLSKPAISENKFVIHFVDGAFVEILGSKQEEYIVDFYDLDANVSVHSTIIKNNCWTRTNRKYCTNWRISIYRASDKQLVFEHIFNPKGKRVLINIDSNSIGDMLAWTPYCLEFQKKHECSVVVCTEKNEMFESVYPELEFVAPGVNLQNLYAIYNIGWYHNENSEPVPPNTIKLQQTATNILNLEFEEIKPRLDYAPGENEYGDYVVIATNSTAACKFWTKEGWQGVINYLHNMGYKVINVSLEENLFENAEQIINQDIKKTMSIIHHAKFFIGLGSGISWLAWALNKPVIMIANFSEEWHEFSDAIRVVNKEVCHGCWNNPNFKFDKGDWNWCPINKGTPNQHICQKSITPLDVVMKIREIL
jgi:autotransporter strand-loop-strand O-heptosyltransferase